jgi:hypothetical protein
MESQDGKKIFFLYVIAIPDRKTQKKQKQMIFNKVLE